MKNLRSIRSALVRAVSGLAVAAFVAGTAAVIAPAPASAAPVGGLYKIRNHATGKCLDSRGDSVYAKSCVSSNNNQVWVVVLTEGHAIVQNLATARCLDSNGAGTVYTLPCNTKNRYQQWQIPANIQPIQLKSRATGRHLDSNSHQAGHPDRDLGAVYTLPHNGGRNQRWHLDRL